MPLECYKPELNKIRGLLVGSSKGLTVTEISRKMGINRNSVAKYLDVLHTSGIIEVKIVGSAKLYTLSKRVPLTSIVNLSSDYILVLDDDWNVTYANENLLKFEKKSLAEISGRNVESLDIMWTSATDIRKLMHDSIRGTEIITEIEIQKDGKIWFFRVKFVPGVLENGKKGLIAILTDITDLKIPRSRIETLQELPSGDTLSSQTPAHHEAANPATGTNVQSDGMNYRDYLEIAPEGIWAFDKDLKTTFVNAWMAGMLGFSPGEMIGKSLYTYLDNAGKTALKKYLKYLQEGRIVLDTRDFEIIKKDGSKLFSTISISPFVDKSGILHGALAVVNDITARKQAEDTLRLSEKYYRTIIETSPNGIVIFNPLGEIKMVNRQTSRYLGYDDPKDLDGKNIFNFISLNDVEKCQTLFRESSLNNKKISSIECTLIKKDSSGFCVDLVISLFGSQSENEEFFIGMITDVTERRRADIRVRKSEQKYRSLVQGISHIIFSADLNGKITYISPVVWKILGYSPDELLGKHFFALVSSDSRHMLGLRLKEAQAGKLAPADFQLLEKSGTPRWVRIIAQPLLEGDRVTGITGLIGDINDWKIAETALVNCELKYKAVVEDQTDLICRFLPDFTIVFVNPAFCRFFMKKEDLLLNQKFLLFLSEKYQDELETKIGELTVDRPVKTHKLELETPNRDISFFHMTIRAIFNRKMEIVEYQVICRDITELMVYFERSQKLLEELQIHHFELKAQNDELKRLRDVAEQSEQKYHDLYNAVPIGNVLLNAQGMVVELNQAGARLLGKEKDRILKTEFTAHISPEFRNHFRDLVKRVIDNDSSESMEIRIPITDNPACLVAIDAGPVENYITESRLCRILMTDVTESRKNEELLTKSVKYFHDLFKSSEAAMMIIEPESGTVSDANGAACRCFGLAYKDLVGQKAISNIRSHPVITHDDIAEAVAKQKVLAFMHTKTNGDVHEVEIFGYPVFLEGHRMLHTIIRDVSGRPGIGDTAAALGEISRVKPL